MSSSGTPKAIPGSERVPLHEAEVAGAVDPSERIIITVQVRSRTSGISASDRAANAMEIGSQPIGTRKYLSREKFAAQQGADPQDLAKIEAFAHEHGLTVVESSVPGRTVKLSGTIRDLSAAFGVQLQLYKTQDTTYRGRTGPIYVPGELADIITGVHGLDNRPVATPHFRRPEVVTASAQIGAASPGAGFVPMNLPGGSFTAPMVAQLYDFPTGLDGTGQCIAILELGGGYTASDLQTYFSTLSIPMPQVTAVSVDGAANSPAGNVPDSPDVEVCLDIEVAGAVAPGASIAVYFAPNTTAGFVDAVNAALHDTVRNPSVISISWGMEEDFGTPQFRQFMDQAFQDAATLGVTVCVASGDHGSSDEQPPKRDSNPHVDFPASSPFALACGGTTLFGSGTTISSEVAWNENNGWAGGGGVSDFFTRPLYQAQANVPNSPTGHVGRGVPDVAGNADGRTGYQVVVFGQSWTVGGTSAVAPLWAGLIALINQKLASLSVQPAGFINPLIYGNPGAFHDIVQGNNEIDNTFSVYAAGPGWDACTGLGTPDGASLLNVLKPIPTITWANPADIVYGTPVGPAQLNATASVAGSFVYTPPMGTCLPAGTHTLSAAFTPNDPVHYQPATATVQINVQKAAPLITWANPADIVYGTPLGATQLNAAATWVVCGSLVTVSGTFTYTPGTGTKLNAGPNQTLSVTVSPADSANYNPVTATVHINVLKATPTITWANPANIVYGTRLGPAQLNATAPIPGTFTYTPPAGTVFPAGLHTLIVVFAPNDMANYNPATASVQLDVLKATPTITWANPADIDHGAALDATQLNASASWVVGGSTVAVPGTFTYTPAAGTVLDVGIHQPLTVNFAPADTNNYLPATKIVYINVKGDKTCWTQISLEQGKDRTTGSRAGRFDIREVLTGRLLAKWYPVVGSTNSGCFSTLRISFDSVAVTVTFYPDGGGAPILMKVLNPGDTAGHGWISHGGSQNECASIEVEYP